MKRRLLMAGGLFFISLAMACAQSVDDINSISGKTLSLDEEMGLVYSIGDIVTATLEGDEYLLEHWIHAEGDVEKDLRLMDLDLYPNPFRDELNLKHAYLTIEGIQVFDLNGNMIFRAGYSGKPVDTRALPGGFFLLKINYSDSETPDYLRIIKN